MSSPEEMKKTPLFDSHVKLGAKMVPFTGYSMPIQYQGIVAEHKAVRSACGLFDVCHMGEIRITGVGSLEFVDGLVTNDLLRIEHGQAMYTCACRENGGIIDDLIVYKQADDDILIVCNASNREKFWMHLQEQVEGRTGVSLVDESDDTGLIALQGPNALRVLTDADKSLENLADELGSFRFRKISLKKASVTIARTGYTGEDGVEIFCQTEDAAHIWNILLSAGESHGIAPAGLGARDTLRLEARLSLYGNELSEDTNPLEAGLGWTVKLDAGDFLGKGALLKIKSEGLNRRLVGFEVTGRGSARAGYTLLDRDGNSVGICTSGSPSPTLGKPIGLGYLPLAMTEIGTEFFVDARGKQLSAKVVKTPFYQRS